MKKDVKVSGQDGDRLDSWKRIAAYLGKDVRTAMRWSKDGGMPVHRHDGSSRGAVYAYRSEIDEWLHSDRTEHTHGHRNPVFVWAGVVLILVLASTAIFLWQNASDSRSEFPVAKRP